MCHFLLCFLSFYFKPCLLLSVSLFSNCVSLYFAFFVLFQAVSVVSVSLSTSLVLMEDLSTRWKKLSLSKSEENRVALRMNRKKRDFILAGKFFTRRSLKIKAVAKTFRPLWHTKGGFNVTVGGENILLFAFELEVDAERVILGEPWAFDRHFAIHTLGFKSILGANS